MARTVVGAPPKNEPAAPTVKWSYTRPVMYKKQGAAIFDPARMSFIEASSKAGKTSACIVWIVEQAMNGVEGQNFWWIAPILPQAKIAFSRTRRMLPKGFFKVNMSETTLELPNGCKVWYKGSDNPDSLYGEDVYACVIDEASRVKEEAWIAIRSTITATRAPARIIGNVKGRLNWFYKACRRAEKDDDPNRKYHKITADDAIKAGVLSSEEIEDARNDMPEDAFNQLFYAEASDDGGNPFGEKYIHACVAPMSDLPPVAWGWDLAKKHDYTVGIGLDQFGYVCRFERWQKSWKDTIRTIRDLVGDVPAFIDSTGVGDPVVEQIQSPLTNVDNLDDSEVDPFGVEMVTLANSSQHLQREFNDTNIEGILFTQKSKQQLMEGLAVSIQHETIHFPEGPIKIELESFEYVFTRTGVSYSAPDGEFDDCVCSLALADQCLKRKAISVPSDMDVQAMIDGLVKIDLYV